MSTRYQQLADGNSDGTILGQNALDPVSLYNVVPVAQQASVALVATAALAGGGCTYLGGAISYGMANATAINALILKLQNLGVISATV